MDVQAASAPAPATAFSRGLLGDLDAAVAEKVVAAGGDVAMVIDRDGVIRDIALSNENMAKDGAFSWLDRPWLDTVTLDSKPKVDELLRDAVSGGRVRWREVNQITPNQDSLMVRYVAMMTGNDGRVIAIGRDERATQAVQKRLMEAQQAMERDYARLRDAEFRYRLLFRMSGEAVLVVDAASRKVMEANPAAERFLSKDKSAVIGETFGKLFDAASQDDAASLLTVAQSTGRAQPPQMRLSSQGRPFDVSASLFRQDRASLCLIRLAPAGHDGPAPVQDGARLETVIERIPDAFVLTDPAFRIIAANTAFLDLVRIGTVDQAVGQSFARFLGRPGLDRNVLLDTLRAHGSVRSFATLLRNQFDETEEVEVSAVSAPDGEDAFFGFTLRNVERRLSDRTEQAPELRRSVEQLTELVGRVTLKELVRETTDLVEKLCIEAALELTRNNRASAAEVLGLSRQSLYSKLHRFGLGNLSGDDTE
jgi:transcriptional regulator PpsR